jgi:hypothetical protein
MYTSSQSFAPMSRLMWKEYRAQRALWLAVCAFGVVPQVLFRLTLRHPADLDDGPRDADHVCHRLDGDPVCG